MRVSELREVNATTWYLFVYADGTDVRAELSCPSAIIDSQFAGFNERILLVRKGEWAGPDPLADDTAPIDFEVPVSRKD